MTAFMMAKASKFKAQFAGVLHRITPGLDCLLTE